MKIGFVISDVGGLQSVKGVNLGDNEIEARAAAQWVDANGGLAGRRIVPVFQKFDAASNNWERDYQGMCTAFTEDEKVFAVVSATIAYSKTFASCLKQHDTPLINSAGGVQDDQGDRALGRYYYTPGSFQLTRMTKAYIEGLRAAGFFARGSRVGLVRVDDAPFARVAQGVVRPLLAAAGVTLTDEAVVGAQESLGNTTSQMPSIVLRFQQKAIDRVLVLDNGTLAISFALQAASQGYLPRYGLNSLNNPILIQQNVPSSALAGAVGVGWQPSGDVDAQREPALNVPAKRCNEINARAGQGDVSRTGVWVQRMYCDGVFFLQAALGTAAGPVTIDTLLAGVGRLGTGYESAITFSTAFSGGRRDGASSARLFVYQQGCNCFSYTGASRRVS